MISLLYPNVGGLIDTASDGGVLAPITLLRRYGA
jgi:hypothetical protein